MVRSAVFRRSAFSLAGILDRAEVRTVGRQVEEPRACRFDSAAHVCRLVGRQIVHHDDIAGLEGWNEH